jgi:hypothetical protein
VVTVNASDDGDTARSRLAEVDAAALPTLVDPTAGGRVRLQRFSPVTSDWLVREILPLLRT